eukprot:3023125-Pleurochrysis_carterae.AAC.1
MRRARRGRETAAATALSLESHVKTQDNAVLHIAIMQVLSSFDAKKRQSFGPGCGAMARRTFASVGWRPVTATYYVPLPCESMQLASSNTFSCELG